jgi:hypothetical protein
MWKLTFFEKKKNGYIYMCVCVCQKRIFLKKNFYIYKDKEKQIPHGMENQSKKKIVKIKM